MFDAERTLVERFESLLVTKVDSHVLPACIASSLLEPHIAREVWQGMVCAQIDNRRLRL